MLDYPETVLVLYSLGSGEHPETGLVRWPGEFGERTP